MVRWDSPLFTTFWTDADIPGEGIWDALTKGVVKPPNAASLSVSNLPLFSFTFTLWPHARSEATNGYSAFDAWQAARGAAL